MGTDPDRTPAPVGIRADALILGVVGVALLRFGGGIPVAAIAAPLVVVTVIWLVGIAIAEVRASRRWSLH